MKQPFFGRHVWKEHPNYTDVLTGELHTKTLIDAVRDGPNWHDTVIIVTYDPNGGC
jgi:phospholipase C